MKLTVVPGVQAARIARLGRPVNWEVEKPARGKGDLDAALLMSAEGRLVLYVPPSARLPTRIVHLLVPHDGTPATGRTLDAARDLVPRTQVEFVVLHVPGAELPGQAGSLPAPRMVDHAGQDWDEWRKEFSRRFFRLSPGMFLRLEIAVGPKVDVILETARRLPADLLILAWRGFVRVGRATTLRSICAHAPCPVLLVGARTRQGREVSAVGRSSRFRA